MAGRGGCTLRDVWAGAEKPARDTLEVLLAPHESLVYILTSSTRAQLKTDDDRRPADQASEGPCDILGAAGNPCVAAHSTVRALFAKYAGPLYTVLHTLSNQSADIRVLEPGGFANVTQHEAICPTEGECVIARVVDQSRNGNHLTPRDDTGIPGRRPGHPGKKHNPVDASKHKIHVGNGSTRVYGMYFDQGMGYKNNKTKGVATGDGE